MKSLLGFPFCNSDLLVNYSWGLEILYCTILEWRVTWSRRTSFELYCRASIQLWFSDFKLELGDFADFNWEVVSGGVHNWPQPVEQHFMSPEQSTSRWQWVAHELAWPDSIWITGQEPAFGSGGGLGSSEIHTAQQPFTVQHFCPSIQLESSHLPHSTAAQEARLISLWGQNPTLEGDAEVVFVGTAVTSLW